jgi:chromosome segregation protein
MRLQELTLIGFKSFKDRTKLNFEEGITAVVGPNGCGKSNIVDAIFWVLGDQSPKHLRTQNMSEIVFAGTDQHKASGFCEVTLKLTKGDVTIPKEFDDESINHVSVTRRLYVDGESEYLINGNRCRLKDVVAIFLDSGLVGSSYGIIQQGVISQMIQSKPVDRSLLIQEVAGLTKYKVKKDEAQRKMKLTKTHCTRIQDLIGELEKQQGSLASQAEDARRYKEVDTVVKGLHDRVRSLEGTLLETEISEKSNLKHEAEDALASVLTNLNNSQAELETTQQDLRVKEEGLKQQRVELEQSSQVLEQSRLEVNNLFHNSERLCLLITQSSQEIERLTYQVADTQRRKSEDEAQVIRLSEELKSTLEGEDESLEQRHEAAQEKLTFKTTELETQQSELSDLQQQMDSQEQAVRESEDKKRSLEHEIEKRTVKAEQIKNWIRAQGTPQDKFNVPESVSPIVDSLKLPEGKQEEAMQFFHLYQNLWTCKQRDEIKQLAMALPEKRNRGMMVALTSGMGEGVAESQPDSSWVSSVSTHKVWDRLGPSDTSFSVLSKPLYEVQTLDHLLDILENHSTPLPCHFRSQEGAVLFDDGVIYFPPTTEDKTDIFHHKDQERHLLAELDKIKIQWNEQKALFEKQKSERDDLKQQETLLESTCETLVQDKDQLREAVIRLHAQVEAYNNTKKEREEMIERHQNEVKRLADHLEDLDSQIKLLGLNQKQYGDEKEETHQKHADATSRSESLDAEHVIKKQAVDTLQQANEKLIDHREGLLGQTRKLEKDMSDLEQQKFQLTSQIESATARLEELKQEEPILPLDDELKALSEDEKRPALSKMTREYNSGKRELEKLGDVNLLAIHQYEEIKERLVFLTQQRDDLLESLQNLESTIQEIQGNVKETFMEVFHRVNDAFQKHFPVLFRGGKGFLSLVDEMSDDGLPGIEIHAAPPGKKMKHNALLSGGEKALVALGLIISLFEVKPSPFLVMDEVDGPFDEANVESFIDICKHIAKLTQVILITHNKKTMQSADTLYGVTLREKGISQIVSVRLVPGQPEISDSL